MKNTALIAASFLALLTSEQAFARPSGQPTQTAKPSSSKAEVTVSYNDKQFYWQNNFPGAPIPAFHVVPVTEPKKVEVSARVSYWGNDRLSGSFSIKGNSKCGSVQKSFVGQGNGFGSYDLYASAESVGVEKPFAGLSRYAGGVFSIEFKQRVDLGAQGKRGGCTWTLDTTTDLSFGQ